MKKPLSQYESFLEAARKAEADDDASASDALMKRLGQTPPDHKPKPVAKRRRSKKEVTSG